MKPTLPAAALFAAAFACAAPACAQAPWPNKTVTLIVPAAAGGTTDIAARMLAEPLGKALGQTVIVDNRAGASGNLAAVAVKRADADGHTLLMQYSGYHVISPHVSRQPPQWQAEDFRAIGNVLSAPQLVVVREGLPFKTMAAEIAKIVESPAFRQRATEQGARAEHLNPAAFAAAVKAESERWAAVVKAARIEAD